MKRLAMGLSVALVSFGLSATAGEKKEQPKPKPNPAYTNEKEAGPEFQIQGEYSGPGLGAQVIAVGESKYAVNILEGGLPGAGGDGKTKQTGDAITVENKVVVEGKGFSGEIKGGVFTLKREKQTAKLARVVRQSPTAGQKPPPDAVVLFSGTEAGEWQGGKIVEGNLLDNGVVSKKKFKDFTLHMEFRLPLMPYARGQGRANSGVYLQNRYELQILDSFGLKGVNNECGGFYSQFDPRINMCLPPLTWQTYDIDFTAARFDTSGKRTAPARATVRHNGVVIHDNIAFPTFGPGGQKEEDTPGPFQLQNHGNPVHFRNIWVVDKSAPKEVTKPKVVAKEKEKAKMPPATTTPPTTTVIISDDFGSVQRRGLFSRLRCRGR